VKAIAAFKWKTGTNPATSARCPVSNVPSDPEENIKPRIKPEAIAIPPGMIRCANTTIIL
jgi:hypothetical protein